MKAIILLNGEPYRGAIAEGAYVYCCDGAYKWAKDKVRIDENLGDYDSLPIIPTPAPKEIYPSEKNETDGEIALHRAIAAGATNITIYGGGGAREDHFLGNLHLLYAAHKKGVRAEMITNYSRIFAGEGLITIDGCKGKTLSVLPFGGDVRVKESGGLKYPLHELELCYGTTRGISNIALEDEAYLLSEGTVLIMIDAEAV